MGAKTVSGSGGEKLGLWGMDSSAPTTTNMTEPPLWTPLSSCSPASASPSLPGESKFLRACIQLFPLRHELATLSDCTHTTC